MDQLLELGAFAQAGAVFELGCGTGRLAAKLLEGVLAPGTTYLATDVSSEMVAVASRRLSPWAGRAAVQLLEPPALELPGEDAAFDRFLSTYVFDLLAPEAAGALLSEAARLLIPGGLLMLVSLTRGTTAASRVVCSFWSAVALRWPSLIGGCRPIELTDITAGPEWRLRHNEVVVRLTVPSQVVVAERTASPPP